MPDNKVGAYRIAKCIHKNPRIHRLIQAREDAIEHGQIHHRDNPRQPRRPPGSLVGNLFVVERDENVLEKTNQEKKNVLDNDIHKRQMPGAGIEPA